MVCHVPEGFFPQAVDVHGLHAAKVEYHSAAVGFSDVIGFISSGSWPIPKDRTVRCALHETCIV